MSYLEGLGMMPESSGAIVSDDVWKTFDMDILDSPESEQVDCLFDISSEPFNSTDSFKHPEILRHNCMWTGLCVNYDHEASFPSENYRISPPRISSAAKNWFESRLSFGSIDHQQKDLVPSQTQHSEELNGLEIDGDLLPSEKSQTSSESDSESEEKESWLQHDEVNIVEKSVECKRTPESEINRQNLRISAHHNLPSTSKAVLDDKPVRRPRGRPPNSSRKCPAKSQPEDQKPPKRAAVRRSHQEKTSNGTTNTSLSISIDSNTIRTTHNEMERKRRDDLCNAYDELRCLLPDIDKKTNASKSAILQQGAEYCITMSEIDRNLAEDYLELKKRQHQIRKKISFFRRCLAERCRN